MGGVETQQAWVQCGEMYKLKFLVVFLAVLSAAEEKINTTEAGETTTSNETTAVSGDIITTTPSPTTTTTTTETEGQETTSLPEISRPKLSDEDRAWVLSIKSRTTSPPPTTTTTPTPTIPRFNVRGQQQSIFGSRSQQGVPSQISAQTLTQLQQILARNNGEPQQNSFRTQQQLQTQQQFVTQ